MPSLQLINWPAVGHPKDDSVYADIMSHTSSPYSSSDKVECCHEQTHQINSEIRNRSPGKLGFYLLNSKAALVDNMDNPMVEVQKLIPESQKGHYTYDLYIIQQGKQWDIETLWDEFSAYCNGIYGGFDCIKRGDKQDQGAFQLSCCLEFVSYILAGLITCDNGIKYGKISKSYSDFAQLVEISNYQYQRVVSAMPESDRLQPDYKSKHAAIINTFNTAPDNNQLRQAFQKYFNHKELIPDYGTTVYL